MSPRLVLNTRYVAEARVSVDLMAGIRGLINPFNLILLSIVLLVAEEAFGCQCSLCTRQQQCGFSLGLSSCTDRFSDDVLFFLHFFFLFSHVALELYFSNNGD